MTPPKLRVVLTNDDGPPGEDSPYIYGLAQHLSNDLGWDVKVVIPSSQKSWIGKAYHIKEIVKGRYYYPRAPDGLGEVSNISRPPKLDAGEFAEWILLDGTPATCANIALHNLFPGQIDLLAQTSDGIPLVAAFALSSGTIGAALSSSLSRSRSIAVSYGTVQRPVAPELHKPAHILSGRIIQRLWENWGTDEGGNRNKEVDFYNINIPMIDTLLSEVGMPVVWTTLHRNSYGRLFEAHSPASAMSNPNIPPGGPDAQISRKDNATSYGDSRTTDDGPSSLVFAFAPDMKTLVFPDVETLTSGSDTWALSHGWASVTPLRASFAGVPDPELKHPGLIEQGEGVSLEGSGSVRIDGVKLFKL